MTTTAGKLDRQILIEKKQVAQDATYGTEVVTWVPLAGTVPAPEWFWAEVSDAAAAAAESMIRQDLVVARNLTRIRLRYRDDISSSMRVTLRGDGSNTVMQIVGGPSAIEGRKQFTELLCERLTSQ